MYSEKLLRHFQEARLAGDLPDPAVRVTVENPVCGDILRLTARVESGRIVHARFQAKGCTASIACGSAVAAWLQDSVVEDLQSKKASEIAAIVEAEVGGLQDASKHAARLAAEGAVALLSSLAA